jgi:hypothetical protein
VSSAVSRACIGRIASDWKARNALKAIHYLKINTTRPSMPVTNVSSHESPASSIDATHNGDPSTMRKRMRRAIHANIEILGAVRLYGTM